MSNNFVYNEVEPEALQSAYQEYDQIDFRLNHVGYALAPNSIRLMADVVLEKEGDAVETGSAKVYYDKMLGGHAFIDSVVVSSQNQGNIENFNNYGRYEKMVRTGTKSEDDFFNSEMVAEMCAVYPEETQKIMQGYKLDDATETKVEDANFFIRPDICFNNMQGGAVSYNKTGEIVVSVRLARTNACLFGADMDSTYDYKLKNFKLAYNTIPDAPEYAGAVQMLIKSSLVSTVNSSHSIVSVKSPIVADSVIMSFISAGDDFQPKPNSYRLETLPAISSVEYQYNDSTNAMVSYDIDNMPELLHYTEEAFKSSVNDFSLAKLENNKGFCIGFQFGYQQLINSKINVVINSSIQSDVNVYTYLNGVLSI